MSATVNLYIDMLFKQYEKTTLTRKEVSDVLGISISSLDILILRDQLPFRFVRVGCSQKARYVFPIVEVANYLAFEKVA